MRHTWLQPEGGSHVSRPNRGPTATRRDLGLKLRGLRDQAGLTVAQVSEKTKISEGQITKIEKANIVAQRKDVEKLIRAYDVTDADLREELFTMVREGGRKDWWETYRDLPPKLGTYLGLESVASALHFYGTHMIHGLLQTPNYARALIRAGSFDKLDHEINEQVELRMRRKEVLTREDSPLTLWALLDESALRRPIGGRETMRAQVLELIEQNKQPNINVLVIPNDIGAHAGMAGQFSLLQFEPDEPPVVYVDGQAGNLYLEKVRDLRRCQQAMNHLMSVASDPNASVRIMRGIAKELTRD